MITWKRTIGLKWKNYILNLYSLNRNIIIWEWNIYINKQYIYKYKNCINPTINKINLKNSYLTFLLKIVVILKTKLNNLYKYKKNIFYTSNITT